MTISSKPLELSLNESDPMAPLLQLLIFPLGGLGIITRMSPIPSHLTFRSEASDVIGWLDFGILGALEKKYLKSLIVVVYLKEETRNK
jgi:hypothetical protein